MNTCPYVTLLNSEFVEAQTAKLIFINVDVFAFSDITTVWDIFNHYGEQHTIASAKGARHRTGKYLNKDEPIMWKNRGINAGLFLIHLKNLKRASFSPAMSTNTG